MMESGYLIRKASADDLQAVHDMAEVVFRHARSESPACPRRMELNVNRSNPAVSFYEHLGMKRLRQGDFHIGGGFYMNDYIMGISF